MMKKSNMLYNEYIYKCIAVKWEDTGDVQEQHELPRQIVTHGFTQRPTPHQLHVAFGHLRCTGEIFHLFTPKTDKIRL